MAAKPNRFDEYYNSCSGNPNFASEEFKSSGSANATSISAKKVILNGAHVVEGDVNAETLESNGSLKVGGSLHAFYVSLAGSASVQKAIVSKRLSSSGSLFAGSVSVDLLEVRGSIRSTGVSADTVTWHGGGSVEEVKTRRISLNTTGGGRVTLVGFNLGGSRGPDVSRLVASDCAVIGPARIQYLRS
ncbi:MAG: hypothetical protein QXI37_03595, partial [Thermoprotei archaeon]